MVLSQTLMKKRIRPKCMMMQWWQSTKQHRRTHKGTKEQDTWGVADTGSGHRWVGGRGSQVRGGKVRGPLGDGWEIAMETWGMGNLVYLKWLNTCEGAHEITRNTSYVDRTWGTCWVEESWLAGNWHTGSPPFCAKLHDYYEVEWKWTH